MNYLEKINEARDFVKSVSNFKPTIGLILGSGLGSFADEIEKADRIKYCDIPHFPVSTVEGHDGKLVLGELHGKMVVAMKGRVHFYEGYSMREITFPVRVMRALGIKSLIVTNACGGINEKLYPGALMFINDHINFTGSNPLIGDNFEELGSRFPDMTTAYDPNLISIGKAAASELQIETFEGVHTAVSGPYYLSKAELRMIQSFGSDTIGMSTIPEVIVANHGGIRSLGICCITDKANPHNEIEPLDHERVVDVANRTRPKFIKLVSKIIEKLPSS